MFDHWQPPVFGEERRSSGNLNADHVAACPSTAGFPSFSRKKTLRCEIVFTLVSESPSRGRNLREKARARFSAGRSRIPGTGEPVSPRMAVYGHRPNSLFRRALLIRLNLSDGRRAGLAFLYIVTIERRSTEKG